MTAPSLIARAPYESTMGLVQKIFYFHVPPDVDVAVGILLRRRQRDVSLQEAPAVDRIACGGRADRALWCDRPGHRSLVGAEGLGRLVAVGRAADDGAAPVDDLRRLSAAARYGGPGSDKLAAASELFGMAISPFVYLSVNIWRTIHPLNTVVPTLAGISVRSGSAPPAFLLLYVTLLKLRRLEEQARSIELYLDSDEGGQSALRACLVRCSLASTCALMRRSRSREFVPVTDIPGERATSGGAAAHRGLRIRLGRVFVPTSGPCGGSLGKVEQDAELSPVSEARRSGEKARHEHRERDGGSLHLHSCRPVRRHRDRLDSGITRRRTPTPPSFGGARNGPAVTKHVKHFSLRCSVRLQADRLARGP